MGLLENIGAILALIGMVMYAAFGGADFGGGLWTALASGPRAHEQRESLFHAIGPVWETNHIWLIFVVVVLFACFPKGFEIIFISVLFPLVFALIGINFRGAAFAFRNFGKYKGTELPATESVFSICSIMTPFFLGMAVSSVASGHIHTINGEVQGELLSAWVSPFTIVGGFIGLAICAYITPFYMIVRTTGELREDFREKAVTGAVVLGILTSVEIPISWISAPLFFERINRAFPLFFICLAVLSGITTLALLLKRIYRPAQLLADFTIALTIAGFGAVLYPYMVAGEITFSEAAAPASTLLAILVTFPAITAILLPSLYLLYKTFGGDPYSDLEL